MIEQFEKINFIINHRINTSQSHFEMKYTQTHRSINDNNNNKTTRERETETIRRINTETLIEHHSVL